MRVARVIIDVPTRALDDPFTYSVPDSMDVAVGCCVLVEFSARNVLGYVVELAEGTPDSLEIAYDKLKPVVEVLSVPYFNEESARLARWISREYLAPLSECLRLFMPPGATPRLKTAEDGRSYVEHPGVGPIDERWLAITDAGRAYEPPKNAAKQTAILEILKEGEIRAAELSLSISNPHQSLKALERRGLIIIENRRRLRGGSDSVLQKRPPFELTEGQSKAIDAIERALCTHSGEVILLDGVTGSGKTEVYLRAIETVLEEGGSAVVLVPEISLTPQTVARFRGRFGDLVAVLHSRMSLGERFDQWELVHQGIARVTVGARSALFAPHRNLRLIIIDEEHEGSYKQNSSPCYVTRRVAQEMASVSGACLVLGSASPSLESLYECERGNWTRIPMPERTSRRPLPPVEVVNLSDEFHRGNKTMFSESLSRALVETVERGEKAVLLLNKRGFASFLLCRDCGYVPECENCSCSLTFHEHGSRDGRGFLMCHHCGVRHEMLHMCPQCGSPYLRQLGPGTQLAQDQLRALLPEGTPIVRMDADTTTTKGSHERLLEEFASAPCGVLLGTQMIAKGLDFPDVTLVGVLIADTTLKFPDFRAAERTYQLLEQVAGRAGRAAKDGRVIVQTYQPKHPAILAAASHNRDLLLAQERSSRAELGYPPYSRLVNLEFWGSDKAAVAEEAKLFSAQLRKQLFGSDDPLTLFSLKQESADCPHAAWQILGPAPCVLSRLKGNYRWHILIKAPAGSEFADTLAPLLKARKTNPAVRLSVDVDPYDLL